MDAARFAFEPNGARALALDAYLRDALADSILQISAALETFGPVANAQAHLDAIRRAPCDPACFARYLELTTAAALDDAPAAQLALADIARSDPGFIGRERVVTLSETDLDVGVPALYRSAVEDDPKMPLTLEPVDAATLAHTRDVFAQALQLIELADPEMAAEIAVMGRQILVVDGRLGEGVFGGAATFYLWGALLINPRFSSDRLTMAESLAHESGHARLFALTEASSLTLNPREAGYASPLRADPRPMEGIVHATYVLARMNFLLRAIRAKCALSEAERAQLDNMIAENGRLYSRGLAVVQADARFTPEGQAIFDHCAAAMAAHGLHA